MNRFGLFRCRGTDFAIPLFRLRKILHEQQVFPLPRLPEPVSGVLVDEDRIIPVLDLPVIVVGEKGTAPTEYMVLTESEYGILAIPADITCGIVTDQKGAISPAAEGDASWLTGQFHFQDKNFQILNIDFLAKMLTLGS